MRALVVGSGGREHALTWKLAQSPKIDRLFVAPGNGGTASVAQNVPISATAVPDLTAFAHRNEIDLTVVGPEAALVAGLVDAFQAEGLRAFGPSVAAAQLEGSKAFAKRFMIEEGIPTAVGAILADYQAAQAYLRQRGAPIVVKASGLAAGKGVTVCATRQEAEAALHAIMVDRVFGDAGDQVLIEDCLEGEEASLLAFTDGQSVVPMLPARDYKPVYDGDHGPNTGGMGGYAPSPYLPPDLVEEMVQRILQPTVDGMWRRGTPYVGVLYAGLMLTERGPQVLEFNCRFGDPETQVLLPLLETDLVDILLACLEGRLAETPVRWRSGHTVCIVQASAGYPGSYVTGERIQGAEQVASFPDVSVFQAGTKIENGELITAGGRVLALTAYGPDLSTARRRAYDAVNQIGFAGVHYRNDIATGGIYIGDAVPEGTTASSPGAYARAGVDIARGDQAVELMREAVCSTYTAGVLAGIGPFGGCFGLGSVGQAGDELVLVASTDGVGTKTMIASAMARYDSVGHDIVNHCTNDILVQGARPLFFLDYVAAARLDPEQIATLVGGCAEACRVLGCALLGGETAEMPGVYQPGTFDLVGTMVGWVQRSAIIDGRSIERGDLCVALPSSGLHTNGFSLARRAFAGVSWSTVLPELDQSLGECLLAPHRAYLSEIETLWAAEVTIKGMAHITGGGLPGNIPRALPAGVGVHINRDGWQVPPIFHLIQERGGVDEIEMYRVFNMGVGLVLLVAPDDADRVLDTLSGEARIIGEVVPWNGDIPRVRI
jgi:phosphoribosylamine--glycine ligase/phosphoribosylformylglycinamidine cyclo-ligase